MADRIVYLVTRVTKSMQQAGLEFVDDAGLARLLAQGFEVSSTLPDRKVRVDGKSVIATMMVLKPAIENRGVALSSGRESQVKVQDDFGNDQSIDPQGLIVQTMQRLERGLATLGGASHLGGGSDRILPGMRIISAERVGQARDLGANAAMLGHPVESCPFPPGSEPAQLWLAGYRNAQRGAAQHVSEYDTERAYEQGRQAALMHGPNDVVSCPYPASNVLRQAWVSGFRAGGGRVEG